MRLKTVAFLAAALLGSASAQTTIYVAPDGADANPGSAAQPVQTIQRAIVLGAAEIIVAAGQYTNTETLTIPAGTVVRGGRSRVGGNWRLASVETIILNMAVAGMPSVLLEGESGGDAGARVEWVDFVGGFASIEMRAGSSLYESNISAGTNSGIFIGSGTASVPALIERVQIRGGGTGVRIQDGGSAELREVFVREATGNALTIQTTNPVRISNSVFQSAANAGATVTDSPDVVFENCVFRRSGLEGLRITRSDAIVRGSLFELNQSGLQLSFADGAIIEHCTIASSRQSGVIFTRSQADILSCIIANSANFGFREEQGGVGPDDPPLPLVTRNFRNNVLSGNADGAVLDEGLNVRNSADAINSSMANAGTTSGNVIGNPLFTNITTGNYRILAGSPALGLAVAAPAWSTDLDGNPRVVSSVADAGAFELQPAFEVRGGLASTYFDSSFANDPEQPGTTLEIRRHPLWEQDPILPYEPYRAAILPGRFRFTSYRDGSLGFGYRRDDAMVQPADSIGRMKVRLASPGNGIKPTIRARNNWRAVFHAANTLTIDGPGAAGPTVTGREYTHFIDLRQGGYRNQTAVQLPSIPQLFNVDMIDFFFHNPKAHVDLIGLEYTVLDRATFEAQFTTLLRRWTFETGADGWVDEPPLQGFAPPTLRYSSDRRALEFVQLQDGSYGTWRSPDHPLLPGQLFMIKARVSSNRPKETTTSFRFRHSDLFFGNTVEYIVSSAANGETAPVSEGREHRFFGMVSPHAVDPTSRVFWDLMGFDGAARGGSIFLDEVEVYSAPLSPP
jgi:hypothetical protein